NQEYESALANFIRKVLGNSEFVESLNAFQKRTAFFGALNSLSQTVLKLTVPGVPDFYQGNELWEFNLVDPDNRRRVDYSARQTFLSEFQSDKKGLARSIEKLTRNMHDGRIKMYVIWQALGLRKLQPDLFLHGDYLALQVIGRHAANGIAFARTVEGKAAVIVVPRLAAKLAGDELRLPIGERTWRETAGRLAAGTGH